jgi:glutamate racemase
MRGLLYILLFFSMVRTTEPVHAGNDSGQSLPTGKNKIKVVVTDSGLGGLDVMDHLGKKLKDAGIYKRAELIFVNALFNPDQGYNALASREAKIDTFSKVLSGIEKEFDPDFILVGCNTLSVLLDETAFVRQSSTPIVGIVDAGIDMMAEVLDEIPNSTVIITGTATTINEDTHRHGLLQLGYTESRIVTQSCPELQSYIERDPAGEDTRMLISVYTEEALTRTVERENIYLSLNCSHFGYSIPLWREAAEVAGVHLDGILNPNHRMVDMIIPVNRKPAKKRTKISYSVVSKVPLKNRESIARYFSNGSPGIADALLMYTIDKDLF